MQTIAAFLSISDTNLTSTAPSQAKAAGGFGAMLSSASDRIDAQDLASSFIASLLSSLDAVVNAALAKNTTRNAFPFSGEFQSTFGDSGPLIDFINATTQRLGLSASQNQSLQAIAVRNKDITNTPADVEKIAAELKQAGIVA